MRVDPISSFGYNARGDRLKYLASHLKKPSQSTRVLDALTFDSLEISEQQKSSYSWLETYINNLPDTIVDERMKKFRDTFDSIEDYLAHKLIIEEI